MPAGPLKPQDSGARAGNVRRARRLHAIERIADILCERGVKLMRVPREDWRHIQQRLRSA